MKLTIDAADFWSMTHPSSSGCLLFTGKTFDNGSYRYGYVLSEGKPVLATHVAWELTRGDLPEGEKLYHTCRNSLCVAPNHLYSSDLKSRFIAKIIKLDDCWTLASSRGRDGYPRIGVDGKIRDAHRVSWEIFNGAIPPGKVIRHRCSNPACVNPSHLALGTQADNSRDMVEAGRSCFESKQRSAKLSNEKVLSILTDFHSGTAKAGELAERYGVTVQTIWKVIGRKTWKHVQPPTGFGGAVKEVLLDTVAAD